MSGAEPVARAHPEPVVLNIGGPLGALIVHWDESHLDQPIEITPSAQEDAKREHQHVLERPLPGATVYAAAFDALHEGSYTLWVDGEVRERDVVIEGGQVTELRWAVGS